MALEAEGSNPSTHLVVPFLIYIYGGIAQLARAHGSYPWCRWFKSSSRYLYGILAQLGEHLPYKQRVIGSSPIGPIDYGWIPEWPKGADCKSVGTAFEGSNPSPSSEFSSYIFEM